jgi:hypothetical protein
MSQKIQKNKRCTIKVRLKSIYTIDKSYDILIKSIKQSNEVLEIGSLFMKSYLIYKFENESNNNVLEHINYPIMNVEYIRKVFSVIMLKEGGGRPLKCNNDPELKEINEYFNIFKKETGINKLKVECISYILSQEYDKIFESILNNIKYHLEDHIKRYIRSHFYETYQLIRSQKSSEELKEFHSNMNKIKNDILNNTKSSPNIYHQWIDNNIKLIIPLTYIKSSFKEDVKYNAYSYIKCMYNMNKFIQSKNFKSLCIFPTKSSTFNNYVKINTAALIDIFYGIKFTFDGNTKLDVLTGYGDSDIQEKVWNSVFNLKDSTNKYIFKHKGFSFNYEIETDGYATSLNFINNNEIVNKGKKKKNTANKREETNIMKDEIKKELIYEIIEDVKKELNIGINDILTNENCSLIEKTINDKFKDKQFLKEYDLKVNHKYESKLNENNIIKKTKELADNKLQKEKKDLKTKANKAKSKEEKEKFKKEINSIIEFPYIEYILMDEDKRIEFKTKFDEGKIVVGDPGKRSILYLMLCNNKEYTKEDKINELPESSKKNNLGVSKYKHNLILNYTSGTRGYCLKRDRHSKMREGWKSRLNKNTIPNDILGNELKWYSKSLKDMEKELSKFNSNNCVHKEYLKYIIKRTEYMKKIDLQYDTNLLQKLRWYEYIDKVRHENNLVNQIGEVFGKDVILILGDWSNSGNIQFKPTPGIALRRKLAQHFNVYLIDEYLTSAIHNVYHVKCDNLYVPIKPINKEPIIINNNKEEIKLTYSDIKIPKISTNISKNSKDKTPKIKNSKLSKNNSSTNIKLSNDNEINKLKLTEGIINKHIKKSKTKVLSTLNKVTNQQSYEKINGTESLKTFDIESIITNLPKPEKIEKKQYTTRKLHAVLVFKITTDMVSNKFLSGCINRDKNSVLNMKNIVNHLIMTGTRPEIFRRVHTTDQCNYPVNCVEAGVPCREVKQIKPKSKQIKEIKLKETDKKEIKLKETNTNNSKLNKTTSIKSKSGNSIKKATTERNCNKIKGKKVSIPTN